jgi:hypothetical protein
MEFIFREGKIKDNKLAHKSSVRFGLCNYTFNHSFPLGWNESIAYKSADGTILSNG